MAVTVSVQIARWAALARSLRKLCDDQCVRVIACRELDAKVAAAFRVHVFEECRALCLARLRELAVHPFAMPAGECVADERGAVEIAIALRDDSPHADRPSRLVALQILALLGEVAPEGDAELAPFSFSVPCAPARPRGVRIGVEETVDEQRAVAKQIHDHMFNVEVCAMEVCAYLIVKYGACPDALRAVLARQCWDEARHVELLREHLVQLGGRVGDHPVDFGIWNRVIAVDSLEESLAVEQVIGEGFALGGDLHVAEAFRREGRPDIARTFEFIHVDESNHVRTGLEWMRRIAGSRAEPLLEELEAIFAPAEVNPGAFSAERQASVGFTTEAIARQASRLSA